LLSFRKAQGHLVIARLEGAIVGRVDDFQFDLESQEIFGYRLKGTGMFSRAGGVSAADVEYIGRDVAIVPGEDAVEWSGAGRNVEPGRAWASQYRGTRVMSRSGAHVGTVEDLVFEQKPDRIVGLVLDGRRLVAIAEGVATGPAAVILPTDQHFDELPATSESDADWMQWIKDALQKRRGGEGAEE
jgi:uncharacterized protein YrrD